VLDEVMDSKRWFKNTRIPCSLTASLLAYTVIRLVTFESTREASDTLYCCRRSCGDRCMCEC